jgi:hypothetical protein
MGFTLRAVLDVLPSTAVVTVAELVKAVIEWNRTSLAALAGHPVRDPRVRLENTDVGFTLRANPGGFDVVLLDTDNGPAAFTAADNAGLYDNGGVAAASNSVTASTDSRGSRTGARSPAQRRAAPHHLRRPQESRSSLARVLTQQRFEAFQFCDPVDHRNLVADRPQIVDKHTFGRGRSKAR